MTESEAIRDLDIIRFNPHWDELVNEEYWQSRHWKRCRSTGQSAHRKNAGRQWKSKRQRNRITKETDTPTDILCMIHGFALAAESTTRLIMIITITARIAVRN